MRTQYVGPLEFLHEGLTHKSELRVEPSEAHAGHLDVGVFDWATGDEQDMVKVLTVEQARELASELSKPTRTYVLEIKHDDVRPSGKAMLTPVRRKQLKEALEMWLEKQAVSSQGDEMSSQVLTDCPTCDVTGPAVYVAAKHPTSCSWMMFQASRCGVHDELLMPGETACPAPDVDEEAEDPHGRLTQR